MDSPAPPDSVRRRMEGARFARLATVAPDGRPRLVPITFVMVAPDGGDVLYSAVDHKPKRSSELARLTDIAAHPHVAVLVDHDGEDWSQLWWVRVRGTARVLRGGDERERALDLLQRKYAQYAQRRPSDAVIAVDVDEWRWWSASPGAGAPSAER